VLSGVEWSVLWGDAIGLLGPNGAGKSTLLKSVVGNLPLQSGTLHRAQGLRVGYFAQHQVDQLRLEESALWHMGRIAPGVREQELRNFLGGFDFRGDQVAQLVASFSGGEKARLALALIVWQRPNLLLLDEPTNHLDIEMRESLAQALTDFEGALVVVAHDRHLLSAATDQWLLVADGCLAPFDGDLDDYKEWAREFHARGLRSDARERSGDRKAGRRSEAEARQRIAEARKPFEKKIRGIEAELEALQRETREAEAWLASGEAYEEANRERMKAAMQRRAEVTERIAALEDEWLWTQASLDAEVNRPRE
jgi:ATP-binding cassette subfamily F protein 3